MNTTFQARAASLLASTAVTFVLVYAMAAIGYPEPTEPRIAQTATATCVR